MKPVVMTIQVPRTAWKRRWMIRCLACVLGVGIALGVGITSRPAVGGEKRRVEMHVVASPGVDPLAPQRWMERLQKLSIDNLRISTGSGDEQPAMTGNSRSVRLTGILSSSGTLHLPGARFSARDQGRLATWLSNLANGRDEPSSTRHAFGLTSQQLLTVHDALSKRTTINTKGSDTTDVLDQIVRDAALPIKIAPAARAVLQDSFVVTDEMRGLSHGTTLAALLRPIGLVLMPTDSGRSLTIAAVTASVDDQAVTQDQAATQESWPIGWPVEGKPRDVAPAVYRKLEISFENVELHRVLDALRQRMKVPILLDQNGIARKQIDIQSVRVSLPKGRTYYKRALEVALRQAKLRTELRLDEANRPFFWATPRTIRRVRQPASPAR